MSPAIASRSGWPARPVAGSPRSRSRRSPARAPSAFPSPPAGPGLAGGARHLAAGGLGYAVDAADLDAVLDGRIETEHFVIHYAHTPEIDAEIELIARDHEFRYAQVVAQLGVAPAGKLGSYYFADRAQKAHWFGAYAVEMAKPWRREIYLDHRGFPHPSLRHEIAHAVASAFGDPI